MKFEGKYDIDAEPFKVWEFLNDPDILRASIPGCEKLDQISPVKYEAVVTLKVGPIKARFQGHAEMTQQQQPTRCVIAFQGSGGIAGMARGEATVLLSPTDQGTELKYIAEAVIGGKIAQIGSKLLEGTARRIADQFFKDFADQIALRSSLDVY